MPIFHQEYIDQLPRKEIERYCKKCIENKEGLCDIIHDSADNRFKDCEILQEIF
jgi:hypothetical protein